MKVVLLSSFHFSVQIDIEYFVFLSNIFCQGFFHGNISILDFQEF